MLQDRETSLENHQRFVRRVVAGGEVWGLKGPSGWATSVSNDDEEVTVMPFWSDRAYAARAAANAWPHLQPTAIPLERFINAWLKGMYEDGVLVGTNWDANNCGLEVDAGDLADELVDLLEGHGPTK